MNGIILWSRTRDWTLIAYQVHEKTDHWLLNYQVHKKTDHWLQTYQVHDKADHWLTKFTKKTDHWLITYQVHRTLQHNLAGTGTRRCPLQPRRCRHFYKDSQHILLSLVTEKSNGKDLMMVLQHNITSHTSMLFICVRINYNPIYNANC